MKKIGSSSLVLMLALSVMMTASGCDDSKDSSDVSNPNQNVQKSNMNGKSSFHQGPTSSGSRPSGPTSDLNTTEEFENFLEGPSFERSSGIRSFGTISATSSGADLNADCTIRSVRLASGSGSLEGPTTGGTELVITGSGFGPTTRVFIGGSECIARNITSTQLTVTTQAASAGTARIEVANGSGERAIAEQRFIFLGAAPGSFTENPLTFTVTTPEGTQDGNQLIEITAVDSDDFVEGLGNTIVTIGGVPCLDAFVLPGETGYMPSIYCISGRSEQIGPKTVVVEHNGRRGVLRNGYIYLASQPVAGPAVETGAQTPLVGPTRINTASPGSGFTLPVPRPTATFLPYAGSEAADYRVSLDRRRTSGYQYTLMLGNQEISTGSPEYSGADANEAGFEIFDPTLINAVNEALNQAHAGQPGYIPFVFDLATFNPARSGGVSFSQTQINLADDAVDGLSDRIYAGIGTPEAPAPRCTVHGESYQPVVFLLGAFPGPAQQRFPLPPAEEAYLTFLDETVNGMLNFLDLSSDAESRIPIYDRPSDDLQNSNSRPRYVVGYRSQYRNRNIGGNIYVNDRGESQRLYTNIMDAIRDNNEAMYLENVVNLATGFTAREILARASFVQTMNFMFVGKRFPTIVARQKYLHFTLQCGHVGGW